MPRTTLKSDSNHAGDLRTLVRGRVIDSRDPEYDRARAVFYPGISRRPVAVVRPVDAQDVANVVAYAREEGAPLAVRSGGHSVPGFGTVDHGIVIDLSTLKEIEIDPDSRTAWAQTGLTTGEYTAAAAPYGLATGFGDAPTVGIGGITLGGGMGFLHRTLGLTIDSLLAAEVVTADGETVLADESSHADLFWAIRGGGGNFGIATRFRFRLHEVDGVTGGMLILPATPERIVDFLERMVEAPESLAGVVNVMQAPPMPMIPSEYHGKPILMALVVNQGDSEAGEAALAPLRELGSPVIDTLAPIRYLQMYEGEGEGPPVPPRMALRSDCTDGVDVAAAEELLDHLRRSRAPFSVAQFRILGGAVGRVPAEATAFAHRDRVMLAIAATTYGAAADLPEHQAWADSLGEVLRNGAPGAYVGFLGDEGPARVREAYPPATWERLTRIKAQYDPTNLFRLNHNVTPSE